MDSTQQPITIRPNEIMCLLGVSRSHFETIAKQDGFPPKIKLSARVACYSREKFFQWFLSLER
jgi:predicted DNA-binding transcriptional regulator AlpA